MGCIHADMVDYSVSAEWWKKLIRHFANVGDEMEIRCWKEETVEISRAAMYGAPSEDGYEVSVKGTVTPPVACRTVSRGTCGQRHIQ